jgi:PAS domain-containing protein
LLTLPLYALYLAVLYHPTMPQLTQAADEENPKLSRTRLVLLAAAQILPALVLAYEIHNPRPGSEAVIVASAFMIAVLVLVFLARVVRANEARAERERTLHEAGATLVAATNLEEIYVSALKAVQQLVGECPEAARVSVLTLVDSELRVEASRGAAADRASGVTWRLDSIDPALVEGLNDRRSVIVRSRPIDLPDTGAPDQLPMISLVPLVSQNEVRGAIVHTSPDGLDPMTVQGISALATEVSLAIDSAALTEDLLREKNERRFRALFENSSDVVTIVDSDLSIAFCSPAAERILGRPIAGLVGTPPFQHAHRPRHPTGRLNLSRCGCCTLTATTAGLRSSREISDTNLRSRASS